MTYPGQGEGGNVIIGHGNLNCKGLLARSRAPRGLETTRDVGAGEDKGYLLR